MSRTAGLVVLGLLLSLTNAATVAARARRVPQRVVLDYRRLAGAERCPSRAELQAKVSEIVGYKPFSRTARRTVRCVLRGKDGGVDARVQLVDTRSGRVLGVRELSRTGAGCEELGGAMALAIALAIDPLARPPAPRPPAPGASAAAGVVAARPLPPPPPAPVPRSSRPVGARPVDAGPLAPLAVGLLAVAPAVDAGAPELAAADAGTPPPDAGVAVGQADAGAPAPAVDAGPGPAAPDAGVIPVPAEAVPAVAAEPPAGSPPAGWRPVVGVGAVAALGTLPGLAGGVLVHAGAASSTASLELEGRWLPGTSLAFGGGSISTSMVSAAAVGCARFAGWAVCGLTQAGRLQAQGQGYDVSEQRTAWVWSVGARAGWEWVFADPIGIQLQLDGAVNLIRARLLVGSQEAWKTPPLSMSVGGGLFGRF